MRLALLVVASALLASPVRLAAQSERLSLGISLGTSSDFDRGQVGVATAQGRHFSLGMPLRVRLVAAGRYSLVALGTLEWSVAPASVRTDGLTQLALGPEVQARWTLVDARVAGLLGSISRRNDWADEDDHRQYGVEAGAGVHWRAWRLGYSYRQAWVEDVARLGAPCPPPGFACRAIVEYEPPTTESYNRHALTLTWQY
jgi:hypothetical protein